MSYLQHRTNQAFGVSNFLMKQGYDVSGRGKKCNDIMIRFLKHKKLPYQKWNWKYKGFNTAELINAETIQEYWQEFREWILNKENGKI